MLCVIYGNQNFLFLQQVIIETSLELTLLQALEIRTVGKGRVSTLACRECISRGRTQMINKVVSRRDKGHEKHKLQWWECAVGQGQVWETTEHSLRRHIEMIPEWWGVSHTRSWGADNDLNWTRESASVGRLSSVRKGKTWGLELVGINASSESEKQ